MLTAMVDAGAGKRSPVCVPANATATVFVPGSADAITESGSPVRLFEGIELLRADVDSAAFAVGSGTYSFETPLA